MTDKPKGPKPFLGDADLSELDAWDATFDALHTEEASAAAAARVEAADSGGARVAKPDLATAPASKTLEELSPVAALDNELSLDRAEVVSSERWPTHTSVDEIADASTDHLAIRATDSSGAMTPFELDDDSPLVADEDEIFTSAPRAPEPVRAAPPVIAVPTQTGSAPVKRTAAIIRRAPPNAPPGRSPSPTAPPGSGGNDSAFGPEATRVTDPEELEQRAQQSRTLDARSKAPTAPPPMSFTSELPPEAPAHDDDDDYEIEIAAHTPDDDAPHELPAIPSAPRRTVAHVVRRTEAMPAPRLPAVLAPKLATLATPPSKPVDDGGDEDDFSDVAAALGAEASAGGATQRPRASTPTFEIIDEQEDDELHRTGVDEAAETRAIDASVELEGPDVYVPMGSRLDDELDIPIEPPPPLGSEVELDAPAALLGAEPDLGGEPELDPVAGEARPFDPLPAPPFETDRPPLRTRQATEDAATEARRAGSADLGEDADAGDGYDAERASEPGPVDRPPGIMDVYARVPRLATPLPVLDEAADIEPTIDLEAIQLPEQVQPLATSVLDEDAAAALAIYERELATVDESAASAALRIEAGRLCERLGETDRARAHYDAALLVDPRATAALRGLRRLARASGDLGEATRQLDAELAVAGALERRPLAHYRVDLLLASHEHDLARVAVGELLDQAPSDARALLAQLELAFLDGRADEFGNALEQLAHAISDPALRASVQSARAMLAEHQGQHEAAAGWVAAAADSDAGSFAAGLGAVRHHLRNSDGEAAASAMVQLARVLEPTDPTTAAALGVRAQRWSSGAAGQAGAQLASVAAPVDAIVARAVAATAPTDDASAAGAAFAKWAACASSAAERAYAAARAAEVDPSRGAELWAIALEADPGDDYAAAQLRTAHVAADATQLAIEVDIAVAADPERERAKLRATFGMIAQGQLDGAIERLQAARGERPRSLAIAEALAEALAAAGKWNERATLLGELAVAPGDQLDRDVAQLRSALAWEEAVGAAAEAGVDEDVQRATISALEAWDRVLARDTHSPEAHAAALALATRLGDRELLAEALARAQAAERSPWAAASLALRRARLLAEDNVRAETIAREAAPSLDDPRRTLTLVTAAARRRELGDAATALEERANRVADGAARSGEAGPIEAAVLRLRAAQLALDADDAGRATQLLQRVAQALPALGIVRDMLSAARRRSGDRERSGPIARISEAEQQGAAAGDAFARLVRDGDLAAVQGDGASALALYQRALELRPGDPLAALPLIRVALAAREPAPIAALALARLRAADAAGQAETKAEAYELLAHLDKELRGDAASAQIALESASQADPTRVDLMHRLEREYTVAGQLGELVRLRRAELEQIPAELATDRAAMLMDTAGLAERDRRPDVELVELYRGALDVDARHRLALLHLESIVRRAGASRDLARLEGQIAAYFDGEPRTQAAFYTRAGETLAEIGQIDAAVQSFGKADHAQPGHVPALEGWRQAALKGELWIDVAEAATRQANVTSEVETRARLHHFAGVVMMDKALNGERAMTSFRRALEAEPSHRDAFLRLRILLEEDANHDELAIVLAKRLDHEPDTTMRTELHRAVAELHRNFLSDRETAKRHYREILAADPNDLRAHAAIADIAWEQGAWQEAADALIARARLEREPEVLKTLCFRLGLIYADRLVDVPMALKAFQRALTYNPDDELTLVRLADLATQAGEWKLALGACERLVKAEHEPEKRALHLHRVAKIFVQGFGDAKRAERALNLALDGAPTSDVALEEVVKFYRDNNDMTSVRVHLNRVAGAMRVRAQNEPRGGVAYRVIARAMAARAAAGVDGSLAVARSAAELALLLGAGADPERAMLADPLVVQLTSLAKPEAEEMLFPRTIPIELRQMFVRLGDRIAKHVGVDLRSYGVGRGDRLRAKDSPVAQHAQDVASALGFGEIDVYVSTRQPYAMIAEPTSPVSLVIGQTVAQSDPRGIRFAAGSALSLARFSLAIPARLPDDELGVLAIALLRLFQPEMPANGLDEAAVAAQAQKLKRLIPSGLMNELKPFALAVDSGRFDHRYAARDIRGAGLRAGVVASGSLVAGLALLAGHAGVDIPTFLADPVAQALVQFAISEDHAALAR